VEWRVEEKSIDLVVYGKVACGGGRGISYRISTEKDSDKTETGRVFLVRDEACGMAARLCAAKKMLDQR
jgi:hypothetical protein